MKPFISALAYILSMALGFAYLAYTLPLYAPGVPPSPAGVVFYAILITPGAVLILSPWLIRWAMKGA